MQTRPDKRLNCCSLPGPQPRAAGPRARLTRTADEHCTSFPICAVLLWSCTLPHASTSRLAAPLAWTRPPTMPDPTRVCRVRPRELSPQRAASRRFSFMISLAFSHCGARQTASRGFGVYEDMNESF
ncbi:hypothetical protein EXIGLDRAFT_41731 [Exidia glandulosa HHB12029]|uniref:Uncharacterized protein n=1 Tax=Exidia glandulosa HHB12029 TaxID=1314781 RepID=A0A165IKP6_EXIGL|nr:hypothetical protein EXIGLDRAFT_41731 [Exidia glandulosa HHB12029]